MTVTETLKALTCGVCGICFAMPANYYAKRQNDHGTWYCPNGHPRCFGGETEAEKLQRQLDSAKLREMEQRQRAIDAEAARDRLQKRIAKGVCPCCKRSFTNVQRHMASKHPKAAAS